MVLFLRCLSAFLCNSLSVDKLLVFLRADADLKYPDPEFHSPMRNYGTVDFKKYVYLIYIYIYF